MTYQYTESNTDQMESYKMAVKADMDKVSPDCYANFISELEHFGRTDEEVFLESSSKFTEFVDKTSEVVLGAFVWSQSRQGSDYWRDVHDNLMLQGL